MHDDQRHGISRDHVAWRHAKTQVLVVQELSIGARDKFASSRFKTDGHTDCYSCQRISYTFNSELAMRLERAARTRAWAITCVCRPGAGRMHSKLRNAIIPGADLQSPKKCRNFLFAILELVFIQHRSPRCELGWQER